MHRRAADLSNKDVDVRLGHRAEARMLLRRWLKKHPDSPLAKDTEAWLAGSSVPEDILR